MFDGYAKKPKRGPRIRNPTTIEIIYPHNRSALTKYIVLHYAYVTVIELHFI